MNISNKIKQTLKLLFSSKSTELKTPKRIFNYTEFLPSDIKKPKKALLSYLVFPLLPIPSQRDKIQFSNLGIAQMIPQVLNELGYIVDIIQLDDLTYTFSTHYDLFIGHGGINYEYISKQLSDETLCIYFSTGIYWKEFNIREAERIYRLAKRKGYLLMPDRSICFSEEYANQRADLIICLGNQETIKTYNKFNNVIAINNAAYPVEWQNDNKDYEKGSQNFLFFSGPGNIHKGLDLLIEAFARTNLHLHICQTIDEDFRKVYNYELTKLPNIHIYGFLPMRSKKFEELVSLCNFVISASCAEGQPGSIIECMGYGLIPILTKDSNIELDDNFGILVSNTEIETFRNVITSVSQMSMDKCKNMSENVMQTVKEKYSPESFYKEFKSAVEKLLKL